MNVPKSSWVNHPVVMVCLQDAKGHVGNNMALQKQLFFKVQNFTHVLS